jgi:hypothetical protein
VARTSSAHTRLFVTLIQTHAKRLTTPRATCPLPRPLFAHVRIPFSKRLPYNCLPADYHLHGVLARSKTRLPGLLHNITGACAVIIVEASLCTCASCVQPVVRGGWCFRLVTRVLFQVTSATSSETGPSDTCAHVV